MLRFHNALLISTDRSMVCDGWSIFDDAEFLGEGVKFCDIFLSDGVWPYCLEEAFLRSGCNVCGGNFWHVVQSNQTTALFFRRCVYWLMCWLA